jgi:fumarate reductase flavoprotein subunit
MVGGRATDEAAVDEAAVDDAVSDAANADVAVVGGGLAGWTAAIAAQDAGRCVIVVERATRRPGWGNSVVSGGALHAVLRDPRTDPAMLAATITELTDGHADPRVVQAWAANAARAVAWIEAHGGELMSDPDHPHRAKVFAPVRVTEPGMRYAGFGVANFLTTQRELFVRRGGRIIQPGRARSLARDTGAWQLEVQRPGRVLERVRAQSVVLADGGFQANPALLRRYVGTDQIRRRATGTGSGDGLLMGLANGGVAVNMAGFYGHLLARASLERDDLWPYPILDLLAEVGAVVTTAGTRIVDEHLGGVTTTNAVAWSSDPAGCWLIVDDDAWQHEGTIGVTPPNPWLPAHGATVHTAATVRDVAALAGIDEPALERAISDVRDGIATSPARTGVAKLRRPPFHAIALVAGVTFTLGGLRVDDHARVLDHRGDPIDGLYAAGGTMGGLHGGPRAGYAGGLLEAAVFGLLAGEHAAGEPRSS